MASKTSTQQAEVIVQSVSLGLTQTDGRRHELMRLIAEGLDKAFAEGIDAHRLEERLNWLRKGDTMNS